MEFNQNPLNQIINALDKQADVLGIARNDYLAKEAERKFFEANLISKAPGKSHAERLNWAQSQEEWLGFHLALARLESVFEFQKLKWTVLSHEYQAQYLALKMDGEMVKRQV